VGEGYPVSHKSSHGTISISLQIDCSSANLTSLPQVPVQTWQLNVSNNFITNVSLLKSHMYSNLIILLADDNIIDIETLSGTPFLEKFSGLGLRNNRISAVSIFSSIYFVFISYEFDCLRQCICISFFSQYSSRPTFCQL